MKPEFSKPFSAEHARAGAPYCCRNGETATVLKWDGRREGEPLIGYKTEHDIPASWRVSGVYFTDGLEGPDDLVMLPLGLIDGKPVFVGDEIATPSMNVYKAAPQDRNFSGWSWPAPAKVYPETTMSTGDMLNAALNAENRTMVILPRQAKAIANAALRHAVDAEQLVDAEESAEAVRKAYADGQAIAYKHEAGGRAARDMAVARAVAVDLRNSWAFKGHHACKDYIDSIDLTTIISTVK